ncbi:MAG TPA: hypothetical protein ENI17_00890 [Pseudomonas xinjiangensis]|uniref:Uncharacterized protein n=2 Tax=root TaxID=1 RepID=A0A7V1FSG4_9GAMM|nr:hypothetical protein [Halopseudomonas xinjiangensis]HEC46176.1 hypothetical protein [Halopseudomonas xinjiangensis]
MTAAKPLLTEAVMFFSERGICKEVLYAEFEALLDGLVATPEFADETIEAVFLQINHRLHVRAAVFFTLDFDLDGYVNRLWNMPLRTLAEKAGRGPDMGGGPIRLVCLGFTSQPEYRPHLWKPGQRHGRADLARVKDAVRRNALGIVREDEDALGVIVAERLQIAAEDAWYGGGNTLSDARLASNEETEKAALEQMQRERDELAKKVTVYAQQIAAFQEQLKAFQKMKAMELDRLKLEHADHLGVIQGELLDIKHELASQQKINAALKRDLQKVQSRTSIE